MLARTRGKSSGEARFLKRVLRHDAATKRFFWCSVKRHVQDAAAAHRTEPRIARRQTLLARGALVRLCGTETKSSMGTSQPLSGAPCDQGCAWLRAGLRSCTPPKQWHRSCNLRRSRRWPSSNDWCAICWSSLKPSGFTPGKVYRSVWMCTAMATGQAMRSGNGRPLF